MIRWFRKPGPPEQSSRPGRLAHAFLDERRRSICHRVLRDETWLEIEKPPLTCLACSCGRRFGCDMKTEK
jgi:hypothetical protein